MLRRPEGGRGDLMRESVETIDRQIRQMTRFIDDLLDAIRVSRGKLDLRLEPIDLVGGEDGGRNRPPGDCRRRPRPCGNASD